MIRDTISEIEAKLHNSPSLSEERRRELLDLLATLKAEVVELSKTHADKAQSIADFTGTSTDHATRDERNPESLKSSLTELSALVDEFEKSHPNLVRVVNRISTTLSNLGI